MPVRNEADHLERAVESVRAQHYAGRLRLILAVAPSDDDTSAIAAKLAGADDVMVVENDALVTPAGLNASIRAGSAPVVVRVDGHSRLSDGYVERAVSTLRRTGAGNVGGMQVPEPETPFEEVVAVATTSWLGTGGATYRLGGEEGPVDTVYLGVFDRTALEAVGLFDDRLVRNQDYELNIRLRNAGYDVWFDPGLAVGYRPRGSLAKLAKQYYEYGYWKSTVLRLHPASARARQLLPPLAISGLAVSLAGAVRRPAMIAPAVGYLALAAVATRRPSGIVAVCAMHIPWAAGFLVGLTRPLTSRGADRAG